MFFWQNIYFLQFNWSIQLLLWGTLIYFNFKLWSWQRTLSFLKGPCAVHSWILFLSLISCKSPWAFLLNIRLTCWLKKHTRQAFWLRAQSKIFRSERADGRNNYGVSTLHQHCEQASSTRKQRRLHWPTAQLVPPRVQRRQLPHKVHVELAQSHIHTLWMYMHVWPMYWLRFNMRPFWVSWNFSPLYHFFSRVERSLQSQTSFECTIPTIIVMLKENIFLSLSLCEHTMEICLILSVSRKNIICFSLAPNTRGVEKYTLVRSMCTIPMQPLFRSTSGIPEACHSPRSENVLSIHLSTQFVMPKKKYCCIGSFLSTWSLWLAVIATPKKWSTHFSN